MKKLLLLAILLCAVMQTWADEWTDEEGTTWFYNLSASGKATITGSSKTTGDLIIPEKIEGHNVTYIEFRAFYRLTGLTSVVVPSYVTVIGKQAFQGCTNLRSITLGKKVYCIKEQAFKGCSSLEKLRVLGNVTTVESGAFDGCLYTDNDYWNSDWGHGLNLYLAPDGGLAYSFIPGEDDEYSGNGFVGLYVHVMIDTTDIEKFLSHANPQFYYVETEEFFLVGATISLIDSGGNIIRDIDIPEGVTSIVDNAFSGCTLNSVTIPSSMTNIGSSAFNHCELNRINVRITDNMDFLSKQIIQRIYCRKGSEPDINFWNNEIVDNNIHLIDGEGNEITEFVVPDGIETLAPSTFRNCNGLRSVTIPSSVTSIGSQAFDGSSLATVKVPVIDMAAFCNNQVIGQIKSVINKPVTLIDGEGNAITEYVIPEGVETIGANAYSNCSGLTSVTIPSSVTSIGNSAFSGCTSLESITLPSSTTNIGDNAFSSCTAMKTVYSYMKTPPAISASSFPNRTNTILFVPKGCTNAYILADYWNDFKYILEIESENFVEEIILNKSNLELNVGETSILAAYVFPSDAANKELRWITSDKGVATVDNGVVNAIGQGIAIITAMATDGSGVSATCEVTVTAPSEADTDYSTIDNTIYLERTEGKTGGQVTLSVKMKNTVEVQGFQFDLYLPEGVTVATDEEGFPMAQLSTVRTTKQKTDYFDSSFRPDGSLRVLCGSTKGYVFDGEDGEVALITLNISSDMEEGDYPLILKEVSVSDLNSVSYNTAYLKSTLNLSSYTLGDVNGDGKINVSDFIAVANHILGRTTTTTFIVKAADVNFDNNINVSDFIGIANMILRGTTTSGANSAVMSAPRRADGVTPTDIDALENALYVEPVTAAPGKQAVLSLRMKNNVPVAGFEFNLRLPEGVTVAIDGDGKPMAELSEERTTERKTNFFGSALQADGTLKVLCGTSAGDQGGLCSFNGNEGEVARITVNIPADFAEGDYLVTVANGVLSDVNAATIYLKPELAISNAYLSVHNSASGIDYAPITLDNAPSGVYYTLDGMKLNGKPSKRGVYVVNGKKVVVK